VVKFARFYGVMRHQPKEPEDLALIAEMVTQSATMRRSRLPLPAAHVNGLPGILSALFHCD
jgi:hypothetical protein